VHQGRTSRHGGPTPNRNTRRLIAAHKRGEFLPDADLASDEPSTPAGDAAELQADDAALRLHDTTRIDLRDPWLFAPAPEVRA